MASKDLIIQINNGVLVIKEHELMNNLPVPILEKALKRGKGYRRTESSKGRVLKRNAQGFDRWQLYEILKANIITDNETVAWIEGMDKNELKEAIIEFLLARNRYIS